MDDSTEIYKSQDEDSTGLTLKDEVYLFVRQVCEEGLGFCDFTQRQIGAFLHKRPASVGKVLQELVNEGEIVRIPKPNKGGRTNERHRHRMPKSGVQTKVSSLSSPFLGGIGCMQEEVVKDRKLQGLDIWYSMDRLDLVAAYWKSGLDVVPAVPMGKRPITNKIDYDRLYKDNLPSLIRLFEKNPDSGIGIWVPRDLVVFDVDDMDRWLELVGGEDFETLRMMSGSGRGEHFWFQSPGPELRSDTELYDKTFDIKAGYSDKHPRNGSFVIVPDSIHKSGGRYRWTMTAYPAPLPSILLDLYRNRPEHALKDVGETSPREAVLRRYAGLPDHLTEGQRRKELFKYGRSLHGKNWPDARIEEEIRRVNSQRCSPQLDEKQLGKLLDGILHQPDAPNFIRNKW